MNRPPPGGVGVGGESCKDCSVEHGDVVNTVYSNLACVSVASVLSASPALSSRHPYESYPAEQELGPGLSLRSWRGGPLASF